MYNAEIAGHALTPGSRVRDYMKVRGTEKQVGQWFRKGEKLGEIRDYFGDTLFTEYAPEDGMLLHQCSSLNILRGGPMVTYGVPAQAARGSKKTAPAVAHR